MSLELMNSLQAGWGRLYLRRKPGVAWRSTCDRKIAFAEAILAFYEEVGLLLAAHFILPVESGSRGQVQ